MLFNKQMPVGKRCNLSGMGNAENLPALGHLFEFKPHLLGGPAADAGIYLVEDQGPDLILIGQNVLDGKHNARKLAP